MYEITIKNNEQEIVYGYKRKIKTKFYCDFMKKLDK